MAICTGYTGLGVNTAAPHLKLRVLHLEHGRARFCVHPVLEVGLVVIALGVIDVQAVAPGEGQDFVAALKIILDMALRTDVSTHFLAAGLGDVDAALLHGIDKSWPG